MAVVRVLALAQAAAVLNVGGVQQHVSLDAKSFDDAATALSRWLGTEGHVLDGCVTGKPQYESRPAALAGLAGWADGEEWRAYECPRCSAWHLSGSARNGGAG